MRGAGGTRRQRREHGISKVERGTDLELRFARKLFPAVVVLQAVLGFFDSVTSRIVIPRGARNLLCPAASKSEIPRYARNDKF
jgi:hypothetical protein